MAGRLKSGIGFFFGAFVVQTVLSLLGLTLTGTSQYLFLIAAATSLIMTASAFVGDYVGNRSASPPPVLWAIVLGALCPIAVVATIYALARLSFTNYVVVASFVVPGFILGWLGSKLPTAVVR